MELENIVKIGLMVISIPLFFWLRVRTINRRKKGATVRCPECQTDQRLEVLRNYTCRNCEAEVKFFNNNGDMIDHIPMYTCAACQAENFKGVLTCQACGLANPQGIPD
ncbi:MAG: hypothetical protein JXR10_09635 [Cyclobacteriaceae bacterium]